MAMTQLILVFVGSLATLSTIGMLLPATRVERDVSLLAPWVAALFWGIVGLGSFDVIVTESGEQASVLLLAYPGIGLALCCALYGVYSLLFASARTVDDVPDDPL